MGLMVNRTSTIEGKNCETRCDKYCAVILIFYYSYRVILLAAGGIGVTPVIGMLKDIYNVDVSTEYHRQAHPHVIDTIYFLW